MSKTILIVEDEKHFHDLYEAMLEDTGYRTVHTYDGDEAMSKLDENKPDLIILDMKLNLVNGVTFFQHIKNSPEYKDIPVIVLSGVPEYTFKDLKAIDSDYVFLDKALIEKKLIEEVKAKIG